MQNFTFRSRNIILPNNFLNFSSHFQENFFFVLINNFGLYEDTMIFFVWKLFLNIVKEIKNIKILISKFIHTTKAKYNTLLLKIKFCLRLHPNI